MRFLRTMAVTLAYAADHTLAAEPVTRSVWPAGRFPGIVSGGDDGAPSTMTARTRALREQLAQVEARQDAYTDALIAGAVTDEQRAAATADDQLAVDLRARIAHEETRQTDPGTDTGGNDDDPNERRDTTGAGARVNRNEPVYRPDGNHSWLSDVYRSQMFGDRDAFERVQRNTAMQLDAHLRNASPEHRAATVANLAGAVPPQYLVDDFAPIARAGRPVANAIGAMDLPPDGISFLIPRGTTGQTANATAEGAAWTDSNYVATDDTVTVNLFTVANDITRTLLMRGGVVVDRILFPDQVAAYHTALDASVVAGSGTAPAHRGILNVSGIIAVTYTDASPTFQEFRARVIEAIGQVGNQRYLPPVVIFMTPLRWAWCTNAVDTAGRPLITEDAPQNPAGIGQAANEYGQVVGMLAGLPVVTDANIPSNLGAGTNEDRVIVARIGDYQLWEDSLMQFTMEQAPADAPGDVRIAVGGFSLFHAGRYPKSTAVIAGTGLVTPTF